MLTKTSMYLCIMIDFSHQVGSNELTVVNIHIQATAPAGESSCKKHNSDDAKCWRLSPTIQETLKGQSVLID